MKLAVAAGASALGGNWIPTFSRVGSDRLILSQFPLIQNGYNLRIDIKVLTILAAIGVALFGLPLLFALGPITGIAIVGFAGLWAWSEIDKRLK